MQVFYLEKYSSDDLIELAKKENQTVSRRSLHDLPQWGLLPLATPYGRAPGEGVGRYWTPEQASVFQWQMRMRRDRPGVSRGELTLIPVFFWLSMGEDWVPLEQARRALATWRRWYRNASRRRIKTNELRELERHPDVHAALSIGALNRSDLRAEIKQLPELEDLAGRAKFYGKLRGPLADSISDEEQFERIQMHQRALSALELGLNALDSLSDEQLREVQRGYAADISPKVEQLGGEQRAAEWLRRNELPASCANAFTRIGYLVHEQRDLHAAQIAATGSLTSLAFTRLFTKVALAERTNETARQTAERQSDRRQAKRRVAARKRRRN
jgi:hypothetical protein